MARHRSLVGALLATTLTVALAACGVSTSGSPTKEGDALSGVVAAADSEVKLPPSPNEAGSAENLVRDYLKAAAGGLKPALEHVKAYLTADALASWKEPANPDSPPIFVIRLLHSPVTLAPTAERQPVTVDYQMIGQLSDQGRVDDLMDPVPRQMTFWVVPDKDTRSNLRIDEVEGAPSGLLLSDTALTEFYRLQPIYFWDASYSTLVPDPRYLPLTITPDLRAEKLVNWLTRGGPSPGLGGVARLPAGINIEQVLTDPDGTLVVKLSPEAATGGPEALRRLLWQLRWSLSNNGSTPAMRLEVDNKVEKATASSDEYLAFNKAAAYRNLPQRYDIIDGKVVAVPPGPTPQPVLAAAENQAVVSAAIGRNGTVAAYVRADGPRRYLQIVKESQPTLDIALPRLATMNRPAFASANADMLLIASGGRLYSVSTVDGFVTDIPVRNLGAVTAVAVSPDGQRIAFIANGQLYTTLLTVAGNTATIGINNLRPILSGQIAATTVVWTSETWLNVAGLAGGAPALWRVTADSVVGLNLSDSLKQLRVDELVAYPLYPPRLQPDVLALTAQGAVYSVFNTLNLEPSLHSPFFGT